MAGGVRQRSGDRWLALAAALCALALLPAASASAETLTVAKSPTGVAVGTVTSSPAGISCGDDCTEDFPQVTECFENQHGAEICNDFPQSVTLTAGAANGFAISGWSGCGSSAGNECSVSMATDKTVTAAYTDVASPSVSLTEPSAGARSGSVEFKATAADNWEVDRVEFLVRGVTVWTDASAPYSASFDTATVAEGVATVGARAVDRGGNSTTTTPHSITIDNTAPEIDISGPDGSVFGPGSTQSWTFDIDAGASGLAQVQCSVVANGSPPSFATCSDGSAGHSVSDRPGGDYALSVRAADAAGNVAVATRQFEVDATPPETTITGGPPEGSSSTGNSMIFEFSSTEPGSTFLCRVYQSALTPPPFAPCTGPSSHSVAGLSPGAYAFEVVATDGVGNVDSTPARRSFTVLPLPIPPPGDPLPAAAPGAGSIDPKVRKRWVVEDGRTRVRELVVTGLQPGSEVLVRCLGKRCPFKTRRLRAVRGKAVLTKLFRGRALPPRTVIEVQTTDSSGAGKAFRYVTRPGRRAPRASTLCLAPGSLKPQRC